MLHPADSLPALPLKVIIERSGRPEGSTPPPTLLAKLSESQVKLYIANGAHGGENGNPVLAFGVVCRLGTAESVLALEVEDCLGNIPARLAKGVHRLLARHSRGFHHHLYVVLASVLLFLHLA